MRVMGQYLNLSTSGKDPTTVHYNNLEINIFNEYLQWKILHICVQELSMTTARRSPVDVTYKQMEVLSLELAFVALYLVVFLVTMLIL